MRFFSGASSLRPVTVTFVYALQGGSRVELFEPGASSLRPASVIRVPGSRSSVFEVLLCAAKLSLRPASVTFVPTRLERVEVFEGRQLLETRVRHWSPRSRGRAALRFLSAASSPSSPHVGRLSWHFYQNDGLPGCFVISGKRGPPSLSTNAAALSSASSGATRPGRNKHQLRHLITHSIKRHGCSSNCERNFAPLLCYHNSQAPKAGKCLASYCTSAEPIWPRPRSRRGHPRYASDVRLGLQSRFRWPFGTGPFSFDCAGCFCSILFPNGRSWASS